MTNTPYALNKMSAEIPALEMEAAQRTAEIAGTRMLIAEESFDAMVQMLIDAGLLAKPIAAVMYDRLSSRLLLHASGRTETPWAIQEAELIDQATRLAGMAAVMRAGWGRARS